MARAQTGDCIGSRRRYECPRCYQRVTVEFPEGRIASRTRRGVVVVAAAFHLDGRCVPEEGD
jgi:hypothetical protein